MVRSVYAVCADATRPTNADDAALVRNLIQNWPASEEDRMRVKRILNIEDCRIDVSDGVVLAESSADDGGCVVIDISNPDDDWASIPWG